MIRLISALPQGLEARQTVCAARLCALWSTWAGIPRGAPDFYEADGGAALAVLGNICVLEGDGYDAEELREFLRLRGCGRLLCAGAEADRLFPGSQPERSPVLRKSTAAPAAGCPIETEPLLAEVYRLLCDTFDNMADVHFDVWYADLSLRRRRGISYIYGVTESGILQATAGVYYQNAATAVIGSVATRPAARGRGFASALVEALAAHAAQEGKAVLIAAKNEHARALYEHLGFRLDAELCTCALAQGGQA